MNRFVLPVRKGGLGNQMFQVTAGLIYAKETGREVLLPLEFYNTHKHLENDYWDTIFAGISHRIERPIDQNAIDMLTRVSGFIQYPGEPGFEVWNPRLEIQGNVILHGYFQSYTPIESHEKFIREFFLKNISKLQDHKMPHTQRVGIHVRRGDYLRPPFSNVHVVPGPDFYKKAFDYFKHADQYWIFSDDITWCKEQTIFSSLPGVTFIEEKNECRALALMTLCQGGFICAAIK